MTSERPRRSRAATAPVSEDSNDESSAAAAPGRRSSRPSRARSRSAGTTGDEAKSGGDSAPPPSRKRSRSAVGATAAADITGTEPYIYYLGLLNRMLDDPRCDGFHLPVNELWEDSAIPDYFDVIATPMDLGTVKKNLVDTRRYVRHKREGPCIDEDAVLADMRTTFTNCMEYNAPDSDFFELAETLLNELDTTVKPREELRAEAIRRKEQSAVERKRLRDRERRARQKAERERQERLRIEKEEKGTKRAITNREKKGAQTAERVAPGRAADKKDPSASAGVADAALDNKDRGRERRSKQLAAEKAKKQTIDKLSRALHNIEDEEALARGVSPEEDATDEQEEETAAAAEVVFKFVSTTGLEKKRGRKSTAVMALEAEHVELTERVRDLAEHKAEMELQKKMVMTSEEKMELCDEVQVLDFVRMKTVVDIIARGMNRLDIRDEVMVDIDVERVDNSVLREVQLYLQNPAMMLAMNSIRDIEKEIANIETQLVRLRYVSSTGTPMRTSGQRNSGRKRR